MHSITNSDNLKCRLCLGNDSKLIYIFDEQSQQLNIQNILSIHFWFEIKEDDPVSKHICSECWLTVNSFHTYYAKILDIQNANPFIVPIKNEILESTFDELIKKEDETLATNNDVIRENQIEENSDTNSNCNFDDSEVIDEDQASPKSEYDSESEKRTSKKKIKKKTKQNKSKVLKTKSNKIIDKEQILKEDQQIREFYTMVCDLCPVEFEKFQNARTHYREKHQIRGYLTCCKRKFYARYHAVEHMLVHINPNIFRCNICNKSYSRKRFLKEHSLSHQTEIERPFKCEKCPKAFLKKYQYDHHQITHITDEEKKFSCETCGKVFATNTILQAHSRLVHEGAYVQICEICAKSFKNKMFYKRHCEIYHSDVELPKVQCQMCGAWLKHEISLKKHMKKHEESNREHICKICGKQSPNASALRIHIRYVHIDQRVHKCSVCDKAFKRALGLKEHMATHTGETLYTCPHCPRTFKSSANMHSHRKKIHPEEWAANRRYTSNEVPS